MKNRKEVEQEVVEKDMREEEVEEKEMVKKDEEQNENVDMFCRLR